MDESKIVAIASSSKIDIEQLFENLVAAKLNLSHVGDDSQFCQDLYKIYPKKMNDEDKSTSKILTYSLEVLLERQLLDSSLIVSIIVGICQTTGVTPARVIGRIKRSMPSLKTPSPSWVSKHLRAASIVARYPALNEVKDIEKIALLNNIPDEKLSEIAESGTIVISEREKISLKDASQKKVAEAIKSIKSGGETRANRNLESESMLDQDFKEEIEISSIELETAKIPSKIWDGNVDIEKVKEMHEELIELEETLHHIRGKYVVSDFHKKGHLVDEIMQSISKHLEKALDCLRDSLPEEAINLSPSLKENLTTHQEVPLN